MALVKNRLLWIRKTLSTLRGNQTRTVNSCTPTKQLLFLSSLSLGYSVTRRSRQNKQSLSPSATSLDSCLLARQPLVTLTARSAQYTQFFRKTPIGKSFSTVNTLYRFLVKIYHVLYNILYCLQ